MSIQPISNHLNSYSSSSFKDAENVMMPPMNSDSSSQGAEKLKALTHAKEKKPLTAEERKQAMNEANKRYMFDQMIASVRRHNQEMQKHLQEQKEEDAKNGYV
ncbi:MAG: hypothetical protein J6Z25_00110 [Opitutales bacterium]|nr:hypothetical protein [Opitutales bacterium]